MAGVDAGYGHDRCAHNISALYLLNTYGRAVMVWGLYLTKAWRLSYAGNIPVCRNRQMLVARDETGKHSQELRTSIRYFPVCRGGTGLHVRYHN